MAKRRTIDATGSTSSMGTFAADSASSIPLMRSRPRSVFSFADWSSTREVYSLKISYRRVRVACCSLNTVSGLNRCGSPSRRHWYSPPISRRRWLSPAAEPGPATAARRAASSASTENPTPPRREAVPEKQVPMTSSPSPIASKICAPV